jgi:hypothetical protein
MTENWQFVSLMLSVVGAALGIGTFMWRISPSMENRLGMRIDKLAADHHQLARKVAEPRGEIRGRFGIRPASAD